MSVFNYKKKSFETNFRTRDEAFSAMLAYLIEEEKIKPLDAAKQANEFAEIFAANMGIPTKVEPERKGYDKVMYYMKETTNFVKENPQVMEYLIPAVTFIAGLFTGKKEEQQTNTQQAQTPPQEPIDFDNVQ